ncbi:MAG TPA: alpha/beta hydrolase [Solirubrobacteraceae bacterium]|nr:alpha/beta hydrolase [Solirubrobacteraceae bacterium]
MLRIAGDGVTLAVQDEGEGHPVLLVHGFPDSSYVWRQQVPALVGGGMRAIVPDLRGLGESDKPQEVDEYKISRSVQDMVAVLDELGVQQAHVIGHDFGAVVAWVLACAVPDRVGRLVTMSVGHPNTRGERSVEQREKGWYQLLFQFTGVAEELLQRDDWKLAREWLRDDGDMERHLADLARPGALTAGLNWYRANLAPHMELQDRPPLPSVRAPTLGLWSTGDHYLTEDGMIRSAEFVDGPWRYERIEDAGHWMQLDRPDEINELLLEFLAQPA